MLYIVAPMRAGCFTVPCVVSSVLCFLFTVQLLAFPGHSHLPVVQVG